MSRMEIVTRSNRALWFSVAAGPIAWSVDALAAVAIDIDAVDCRRGRDDWMAHDES